MSKGSNRRPCHVKRDQFEANWDTTFREAVARQRARTTGVGPDDVLEDNRYLLGPCPPDRPRS